MVGRTENNPDPLMPEREQVPERLLDGNGVVGRHRRET